MHILSLPGLARGTQNQLTFSCKIKMLESSSLGFVEIPLTYALRGRGHASFRSQQRQRVEREIPPMRIVLAFDKIKNDQSCLLS